MKKVLFLHGWCSDGGTKTMFLRSLGYDVIAPSLSDWSFTSAVQTAQNVFDEFKPDVIVGNSRGGAVAINMECGETPMILLAPAWKLWGKAKSVHKNCSSYTPLTMSSFLFLQARSCVVAAGLRSSLRAKITD